MNISSKETKKRLDIINNIAKDLIPYVYCIEVGGSMRYGQNFQ